MLGRDAHTTWLLRVRNSYSLYKIYVLEITQLARSWRARLSWSTARTLRSAEGHVRGWRLALALKKPVGCMEKGVSYKGKSYPHGLLRQPLHSQGGTKNRQVLEIDHTISSSKFQGHPHIWASLSSRTIEMIFFWLLFYVHPSPLS